MAKYGEKRYGEFLYGGDERPFNVRVILRNKENDIATLIDPKATFHDIVGVNTQPALIDIEWEYNRIGGCGTANIVLALPYQSLSAIAEGSEIEIQVIEEFGEQYTTWYRGEVVSRSQALGGVSNVILQSQGYVMQLERIRLDNVIFADSNTDAIVADIIDTYVAPDTQIKRTPSKGLVRAEGFVVDTITFNGSAMSAIRSLAEISGNAEWGVNNDKEIFFQVRSSDINTAFFVDKLQDFSEASDFSSIINEYKLFGAGAYTRTKLDTDSQTSFGERTSTLQQSAISTNDVADQYIDGYLVDSKDPKNTVSATVGNIRKPIEIIPPQGQTAFSLLGSTTIKTAYEMESINYRMGDGDGLQATIIGGKIKDDIAETIAYLDFSLNQLFDV